MPNQSPGPTGPTGAGPPAETKDAQHPAESWPKMFWLLEWVEVCMVVLLAIFLAALAGFLAWWILTGCGSEVHARLVETIRGMNTGWKICLLILIPLFFRPIYKFMHYLREGPFRTKSEPLIPTQSKSGGYKK